MTTSPLNAVSFRLSPDVGRPHLPTGLSLAGHAISMHGLRFQQTACTHSHLLTARTTAHRLFCSPAGRTHAQFELGWL